MTNYIKRYATKKAARTARVRFKLKGDSSRPRLHVYRSNAHLFAQIINDLVGKTLVSASEFELKDITGTKTQLAQALGSLIAQKAKKQKVTLVKFDRGSNKYHGRIKAFAEAARLEGLEF